MDLIAAMLDRTRETQHDHTRLLRQAIRQQEEILTLLKAIIEKNSTRSNKSLPSLKQTVLHASQWSGAVLAMGYILQGGDLLTLLDKLALLAKLFG